MTVSERVVVITGAGSGIGQALAVGFASDGAWVVGFGRRQTALAATAEKCSGRMIAVAGDVTSQEDVDRLVTASMDRFGRIDVLVNNAGISNTGSNLIERPFEDWARVIEVNLIGLALCTHRVLPQMLERGYGRIINVASRAAESAGAGRSAYAASKAGVISFTKAVAREIDRDHYPDILVNAIIPGQTATEMSAGTRASSGGRVSEQWQEPEVVYPHTRFVVELPAGGPAGRVFFNSEDYAVYQGGFND